MVVANSQHHQMMVRVVFVAATLILTPCSVRAGSADIEDGAWASGHGDACQHTVSASLLQKAKHQDVKSFIAQEPVKAPEVPVITNCSGFASQGRCWHLSEVGESCIATCAKRGRSFSYAIASSEEPLTPKLLDHEPRIKQDPWAALECYVPSEDRYHPANENAAKHVADDIGNWTQETCKLACPCGPSNRKQCSWTPPTACAETFKFKGVEYSGCATADKEHAQPWCQFKYSHKEEDTNDWSFCDYRCGSAQPALKPPTTTASPEEPSPADAPSPAGEASSGEASSTTGEAPSPKSPAAKPNKTQVCYWQPHPNCTDSFQYKGVEYFGCTAQNYPSPWCSRDRVHRGFFEKCTWVCGDPAKPEQPEDVKPEKPEEPQQPETCAKQQDPKRDFIGNNVTLDEVGYIIVKAVPSADSPMNMKRFMCRVVNQMGCKVKGSQALMAFVPLHRNDTYTVLKNELQSICNAGDGWVVPQNVQQNTVQEALEFVKIEQVLHEVRQP